MLPTVRLPRGGSIKADLFFGFIIIIAFVCQFERANGDYDVNCKTKVWNKWLKHCAGADVRRRREIFRTEVAEDLQHPETSEIPVGEGRESRDEANAGSWNGGFPYAGKRGSMDYGTPAGFGFPPPMSGDDLSMGIGLSDADVELLYEEIIARLPRAAKNKEQTIKMITTYAARCCNVDSDDANCSDLFNVMDCADLLRYIEDKHT